MPYLTIVGLLLHLVSPLLVHAGEAEDRLLLAVRTSDVAALKAALASGVNVNTKFRYDRMALSFAADRGNAEVVKVLLEAGADVNARDTFYSMDAMSQAVWACAPPASDITRKRRDTRCIFMRPPVQRRFQRGFEKGQPECITRSQEIAIGIAGCRD